MTIREQVETAVNEQVSAASIKQHEQGIETLYVTSGGEVFWDYQPSDSTWLHRYDGTLTSIYRTGNGSCECNCDACAKGDDPTEWAGHCDWIGDLADELIAKVAGIYLGFFEDETIATVYHCQGCGREESVCSSDPCEGVKRDRES